ncbi:PilZ domain-containing protein, partial [Oleiphilus sp. HI0043]|uniref:PilZ domain-containing protein n=2 Tax=Oleiphilus TaxID=141450 RepID=UPI0008382BE5
EKRDHIRMKLDTPIQVKLDTGNYIEGTCLDLSVNGMQVELDRAINAGECIEACIRSEMGIVPDLVSKATVVRTTQIESGRYLHGVQIQSMQ